MTLPNFVCTGAPKAGTTTIHDILINHPDIYLHGIKETHFFAEDELFSKGIEWYQSEFFSACKGERAIGEVTPTYMYLKNTPERLSKSLGEDIKLIFLLRHPVDRAYSQYLMMCRQGRENQTFEEAIALENKRISQNHKRPYFDYMNMGFYAAQIDRYLEYFPRRNMFFAVFEQDIVTNLEHTIKSLQGFLDVPFYDLDCSTKSNTSGKRVSPVINRLLFRSPRVLRQLVRSVAPSAAVRKSAVRWLSARGGELGTRTEAPSSIDPGCRRQLFQEFFSRDVANLEGIIERDLSIWRD